MKRLNKHVLRIVLLLFSVGFFYHGFSQSPMELYPLKYKWSVGAGLGNLLFYGDVAEYVMPWDKPIDEYKFSYNINIKKDITPALYFQTQVVNGKLFGVRERFSNGVLANEKFDANIWEFNALMKLNVYRLLSNKPRRLAVYSIGGIGLLNYRSKMSHLKTDDVIYTVGYDQEGNKEGKMANNTIYPFGLGLGYALNKKFNVNFEFTYRWVDSDMLDARQGITDVKDIYGLVSVGLTYKLAFKEKKYKPDSQPEYLADEQVYDNKNENYDYDYDYDNPVIVDTSQDNDYKTVEKNEFTYDEPKDTSSVTWDENTVDYQEETVNETVAIDTSTTKDFDEVDSYDKKPIEQPPGEIAPGKDEGRTLPEKAHPAPDLTYKVQVAASYNKKLNVEELKQKYGINSPIKEEKIGNWYKYTVGEFTSKQPALELSREMAKKHGVKGAFIAPYKANERISQDKALSLEESRKYSYDNIAFKDPKEIVKTTSNPVIAKNKTVFMVQVAASKKPLSKEFLESKYGISQPIYMDYVDGWYKYTIGQFQDFEQANQFKRKLRKKNVKGAFVISYKETNRLDAQETRKNKQGQVIGYSGSVGGGTSLEVKEASEVAATSGNSKIRENKIFFTVQVAASARKLPERFFKNKYKISQPLYIDHVDGWYKYSAGVFDNFREANNYKKYMRNTHNVKGAFVTAYHNDKRISHEQARKLLNQ